MSVATECSDEPRVSRVTKTSRNPANQAQTLVGGGDELAARVGRQRAAVELRHNGPTLDPSKHAPFCATLRLHRAAPLQFSASRSHKTTFT